MTSPLGQFNLDVDFVREEKDRRKVEHWAKNLDPLYVLIVCSEAFKQPAKVEYEAKILPKTVPEILESMAQTYRDRSKVHGESFRRVGPALAAMFPDGITLKTEQDFCQFHLLDWIVGKMCRFSATGMNHADSIHDIGAYAAMSEKVLQEKKK